MDLWFEISFSFSPIRGMQKKKHNPTFPKAHHSEKSPMVGMLPIPVNIVKQDLPRKWGGKKEILRKDFLGKEPEGLTPYVFNRTSSKIPQL